MWLEGLGKLKKIHFIGTRAHDLPACSIVHQRTTLPSAKKIEMSHRGSGNENPKSASLWLSLISVQNLYYGYLVPPYDNYDYNVLSAQSLANELEFSFVPISIVEVLKRYSIRVLLRKWDSSVDTAMGYGMTGRFSL
jgi:hypothetical protein